ncbi:putative serine esterase-domain-containing protein [Gloeopeniophorella convolvens]|nr:putative serine esterase-domain-containing protein [Gloeopeniophorella convolvens]
MPRNVHLLLLIHGMWGSPANLASMRRIISEIRGQQSLDDPEGTELHVMLAETNQAESTYDGIDWGGERVATEVFDEIEKLKKEDKNVTRFSVTGYSLGGLLARYVVGILHQRKFFEDVAPVNFNTVATPHLGLLVYPSLLSRFASFIGPKLLSRTGEQFYAVDKWSKTGRPLLMVMADPNRIFYQGLKLFPHIRIYANTVNDLTVPYMTAYIDLEDPFLNHSTNGLTVEYDDKYRPIIKSFSLPDTPPRKRAGPRPFTLVWFKAYKPPLPPRYQVRFPFNLAVIAILPVLFPAFITLVLFRLSVASHSSRARIKLLESDEESATQRLAHILGELERGVEDAVVDMLEEPTPSQEGGSTSKSPRITPTQRQIVAWLNALPQLKKERVFIGDVRNSHGTIVARDVQNFDFHKIGEGVLRHWADAFIM